MADIVDKQTRSRMMTVIKGKDERAANKVRRPELLCWVGCPMKSEEIMEKRES